MKTKRWKSKWPVIYVVFSGAVLSLGLLFSFVQDTYVKVEVRHTCAYINCK